MNSKLDNWLYSKPPLIQGLIIILACTLLIWIPYFLILLWAYHN